MRFLLAHTDRASEIPERGILLSFVHHAQYEGGLFPSLARAGAGVHVVVAPEAFDPAPRVQLRQHFKVAGMAPVVLVTSHRSADGSPSLRVHAPLEPRDFSDPADRLAEIMRRRAGRARLARGVRQPVRPPRVPRSGVIRFGARATTPPARPGARRRRS